MKKLLIWLLFLPTLIIADAVIFSGSDVKALKQNLDLFGVVKVMSGTVDPSAGGGVAAPVGSAYLSTVHGLFLKTGVGNTAWTKNALLPIDLTAQVTGILPTANGGTGSSNLGTGVVKASGGALSSSAVNLATEVTGTLPVGNGGTGTTSTPTNGQIPIGNGTTYQAANITGTVNQVGVTNGAGSITLTTPQDIATTSNVQFANLNATGTTTLNTGLTGPLKASSGVVSSSAIDLASEVTGTLPIANGGTGSATQNFVDLTTNQTVAGEKTFSNTLKSDSIQTTGSSGVVIKNSSGTTVADFGPANTTNASIAGGLNTGGNIAATGTVTGSNLSGTNTGDLLGQGQSEVSASTINTLEAPKNQLTTTATGKRLIETGNNNVIKDPSFEGNSLEWVTYADAAGTAPVDGTGGTANVTVAYTTTNPLNGKKSMLFTKDAVNRQGQGTSLNFTIPDINKGKVNNIKISHDIVSGTYATGDLTMWVINVDPASATNGRVIQPSAYTIENSGLKESKFLEFQSDIDSNLYRLVIHVTSTSASAYSLRFDDVSVGLGPKIYGSVTTDWTSFSGSGSWSTNTSHTALYKRVGDTLHVRHYLGFTGLPDAGGLTINLPSGLSIDTVKNIAINVRAKNGVARMLDSSAGVQYEFSVVPTSATTMSVFVLPTDGTWLTSSSSISNTTPVTIASGDSVYIEYSVPILGWSSSQQLSNDADTRIITARMYRSGDVSTSTGVETKIALNASTFDDVAGFDSVNNRYVSKVVGKYRVSGSIGWDSNGTGVRGISIRKNGAEFARAQIQPSGSSATISNTGDVVSLNVGDYIELYGVQTSGGSLNVFGFPSYTFLSLEKISGPSQIAASDSVSFSANTSTTAATTSAPFIYTVKDHDSHNAYSTVTGKFTAPMSGKYSCSAGYYSASTSVIAYLYKNTSAIFYGTPATAGSNPGAVQGVVSLLQGETVEVRPSSSATAGGGATLNYFSCIRVGN